MERWNLSTIRCSYRNVFPLSCLFITVVDLVPDFGTVSCPPGGAASKACPRGTITYTCTTTGALVWLTSLTGAQTGTYLSSTMPPSPQTLSTPNVTLFQTVLLQNGATLISDLTVTEDFRAQAAMGAVMVVDIICQDNLLGGANMTRTLEISQGEMNVTKICTYLCAFCVLIICNMLTSMFYRSSIPSHECETLSTGFVQCTSGHYHCGMELPNIYWWD